jgi:hypothetical protein
MNRRFRAIFTSLAIIFTLSFSGCTPIERSAYNTAVAAKAFLDSERAQHPECATGTQSTICIDIAKAVGAKDVMLDALTIYCAGPNFPAQCAPPVKGTPAFDQAVAKLQAAIAQYNLTAADLKAATGGK